MDMSFEIVQALKSIARAKDVDEELIIETLQAGLISAARKKFGPESRITVEMDKELSKLTVYCSKDVVEEVEDVTLEVLRCIRLHVLIAAISVKFPSGLPVINLFIAVIALVEEEIMIKEVVIEEVSVINLDLLTSRLSS